MWRTYRALKFLIKGPIILAILVVVNAATYHGHWWVKWAALGIGIAWVLSLLRVIRAIILVGGLAALISYLTKNRRPFQGAQGTRDPSLRDLL